MSNPAFRTLTVLAQDPGAVDSNGRLLRAALRVPAEPLVPGPRGSRVHVIDFDASTGMLCSPRARGLEADPFASKPDAALLEDPQFHAQHVYAIVACTLARFERALGRRVGWGFGNHQIKVAPHAFAEPNAFYDDSSQALLFGYFPGKRGMVFTCLSHDVVAHETAHALLDGLRRRYRDPSSPDQAAFHEGFADVVALLSVLSLVPVVKQALRPVVRKHRRGMVIKERELTVEQLRKSVLLSIGEQMGQSLEWVRGAALRQSALLTPSARYLSMEEFLEPHRRGELLVAAMMSTLLGVWRARMDRLRRVDGGALDADDVAAEGAAAAGALLSMSIRALDYAPPVDLRFGDFVSAVLTSSVEDHPGDEPYGYRRRLLASFEKFGILPSSSARAPEPGCWEPPDQRVSYDAIHAQSLQHDPEEVFRFLWHNRSVLGANESAHTRVLSVRPSHRMAADGFPLRETVAEYVQILDLRASELRQLGLRRPRKMPGDQKIRIHGGGALIFDEFGRLKYHVRNRIDGTHQNDRLEYLWSQGFAAADAGRLRFDRLHRHIHRSQAAGREEVR